MGLLRTSGRANCGEASKGLRKRFSALESFGDRQVRLWLSGQRRRLGSNGTGHRRENVTAGMIGRSFDRSSRGVSMRRMARHGGRILLHVAHTVSAVHSRHGCQRCYYGDGERDDFAFEYHANSHARSRPA